MVAVFINENRTEDDPVLATIGTTDVVDTEHDDIATYGIARREVTIVATGRLTIAQPYYPVTFVEDEEDGQVLRENSNLQNAQFAFITITVLVWTVAFLLRVLL